MSTPTVGSKVAISSTATNGTVHGTVKSTGNTVAVVTATANGGVVYSTNNTGVSVLWDGSVSAQMLHPAADLAQQAS